MRVLISSAWQKYTYYVNGNTFNTIKFLVIHKRTGIEDTL